MAWHPLGWQPSFYSEIEPFPRAVLTHHYPDVPLHGDFTTIGAKEYEPIDLLVGGTPCQSFSVAGLRKGMADDRGNLALEFLKLAERTRTKWVVWENVPGVLSSNGGRDFGSFLGGLGEIGYGYAYRIFNAQYFGVPQRRRRVFLVGYLGDWRPPASVLFERESLYGYPPPGRKKREEIARAPGTGFTIGSDQVESCEQTGPTILASGAPYRCTGSKGVEEQALVMQECAEVSPSLTSSGPPFSRTGNSRVEAEAMVVMPINTMVCQGRPSDDGRMGSGIGEDGDPSPTITAAHSHAVAFTQNQRDEVREVDVPGALSAQPGMKQQTFIAETHCLQGAGATSQNSQGMGHNEETAFTLNITDVHGIAQVWSIMPQNSGKDYKARPVNICQPLLATGPTAGNQGGDVVQTGMQVRRLTPVECERLQGFPDNFTKVPYRGKPAEKCSDGPRYKAMGNSMAVPVMGWIGKRIDEVNKRLEAKK